MSYCCTHIDCLDTFSTIKNAIILVLSNVQVYVTFSMFFFFFFAVFLDKQQGTLRDPAHELRAKCLNVFKQAFETRKSKLVTHALSGLNVQIFDENVGRFEGKKLILYFYCA